jgi:hypothetical protein
VISEPASHYYHYVALLVMGPSIIALRIYNVTSLALSGTISSF